MQTPVMVMNTNSKRESGRKAQLANIQAAKVIQSFIMHLAFFIAFFMLFRLSRKLLPQLLDPRLC